MNLFSNAGIHCVVDGQFGSTGKGALSAWLAEQAFREAILTSLAQFTAEAQIVAIPSTLGRTRSSLSSYRYLPCIC